LPTSGGHSVRRERRWGHPFWADDAHRKCALFLGHQLSHGNRTPWRHYLDEVAAAGYRGTELGPFGYLPKDAGLLRDELARRDLTLIGATHVHTFGDPGPPPLMETLATSPGCCRTSAPALVIMDESN
jgi:inosose dehydratase